MDIIDGTGLWMVTTGAAIPPTPVLPTLRARGGQFVPFRKEPAERFPPDEDEEMVVILRSRFP